MIESTVRATDDKRPGTEASKSHHSCICIEKGPDAHSRANRSLLLGMEFTLVQKTGEGRTLASLWFERSHIEGK